VRARDSSGFTLVELLTVIAILGVLAGLLMSGVSAARSAGKRAACAQNLHQIGIALTNYYARHDGTLPPYGSSQTDRTRNYLLATGPEVEDWTALWADGPLGSEEVLFCPGTTTPNHQFNTDRNPWPAETIRTGYSRRCLINDAGVPVRHVTGLSPGDAVAADLISSSSHIAYQHEIGVNVLYGNGAVRFRNDVLDLFAQAGCGDGRRPSNDALDAIWDGLDEGP